MLNYRQKLPKRQSRAVWYKTHVYLYDSFLVLSTRPIPLTPTKGVTVVSYETLYTVDNYYSTLTKGSQPFSLPFGWFIFNWPNNVNNNNVYVTLIEKQKNKTKKTLIEAIQENMSSTL